MGKLEDEEYRSGGGAVLVSLSSRERQIASAYAGGDSYREIAARLFIAPTTVRTHLAAVYRKLGVSSKIALLRALDEALVPGPAAGPAAGSGGGEADGRRVPAGAVKRQITVLCSLLDDPRMFAAGGDLERAAALGTVFRAAVAEAVEAHHGRLLDGGGEEAVACFGSPFSDETDQERAIRCALRLSRSLALEAGAPVLSVRTGVCTGPAVAVGGKSTALWGGVPLLASALARSARGGGVIACTRTRAALGSLFDFQPLGAVEVDWAGASIRCFSVAAAGEVGTRFAALHGGRVPPIVGRDHEVGLLATLFEAARGGAGRAALVAGEPGVGKSRVVQALCDQAACVDAEILFFQCSPHEKGSPLHPVLRTLRRLGGVEPEAPAAERRAALAALLAEHVEEGAAGRQVLAMLASDREDAQSEGAVAPDRLRRTTLDLLERFIVARARRRPLLLVVEDVHWADPTTLHWLERVIRIIDGLPIFVLATARNTHGWSVPELPFGTSLALTRLSRQGIEEIVAQQDGWEQLSAEAVARAIDRSEGVPLFAEELTRALLDLGETEGAVPSTLQALLAGRLDRLGRAREVAETAAVIGRDFETDLLAEVLPHGRRNLAHAMETLLASGLVCRTDGAGMLQFKHALVRDAAYDSLLQPRRQALHSAVADALTARLDAGQDVPPELIAHHLVEAGAAGWSLPFWRQAGERATRRSANREAVSHLRAGLRALAVLPDGEPRNQAEMELQLALGTPLIAVAGYTGHETAAAYARALELAEHVGDTGGIFQALYGVWVNAMMRGEHRRALAMAGRLVSLALEAGSMAREITARRILGISLSLPGRLKEGQRELEAALGLYRRDEHGGLMLQFGQDPRIAALSILAWNAAVQGDRRMSGSFARRALAEAEALGSAHTLAYATYMAGAVPCFLFREYPMAARHVDALRVISDDQTFPFWRAFAEAMQAALRALQGEAAEAEAGLARALGVLDSLGVYWFRPFIHGSQAQAHLEARAPTTAERHLVLAREVMERTDERWIEPMLAGIGMRMPLP
jgi:predicted ATPase/DNA-binding CsgD family transcriptional regulator